MQSHELLRAMLVAGADFSDLKVLPDLLPIQSGPCSYILHWVVIDSPHIGLLCYKYRSLLHSRCSSYYLNLNVLSGVLL